MLKNQEEGESVWPGFTGDVFAKEKSKQGLEGRIRVHHTDVGRKRAFEKQGRAWAETRATEQPVCPGLA